MEDLNTAPFKMDSSASTSRLTIRLNEVSKKFGSVWIFKGISARFETGKKYAITGANGSGKSTLLKIIAGIITPNAGAIKLEMNGSDLDILQLYKEVSYCAPYLELPEELTLAELLVFHEGLRKLNISSAELIKLLQLDPDKEIRNYSSGMKQRLKLALAFYTEAKVLLLDEPTANLDEHWTNWYLQLMQKPMPEKLVIICSNLHAEYSFCDSVLNIDSFKK